MKTIFALVTVAFAYSTSIADTGTLETIDVQSEMVGVNFEDNNKTLVLIFGDDLINDTDCLIDIRRIVDLEYKTRVMRYFGGLLENQTHNFKDLVIEIEGRRMKYKWSRENVSIVVNKMCKQAEHLLL